LKKKFNQDLSSYGCSSGTTRGEKKNRKKAGRESHEEGNEQHWRQNRLRQRLPAETQDCSLLTIRTRRERRNQRGKAGSLTKGMENTKIRKGKRPGGFPRERENSQKEKRPRRCGRTLAHAKKQSSMNGAMIATKASKGKRGR